MAELNIEMGSSIYDFVVPTIPAFGGRYEGLRFVNTERFAKCHACLPMHNGLTLQDAEFVGSSAVSVLRSMTQKAS